MGSTLNLGSIFVVSLLIACSGEEGVTATSRGVDDADALAVADAHPAVAEEPAAAAGTGQVRVIHLSPDADDVDVFMDADPNPMITDLSFLDGTAYLEVPAGLHTFGLSPSGAGPSARITELELDVMPDASYTASAFGTMERGTLDVLGLEDDTTGIAPGSMRLRITHAADAVRRVDLVELGGPEDLVSNLGFGASEVVDLAAGPLSLGLALDDDAQSDFQFRVRDLGTEVLTNLYAVKIAGEGPLFAVQLPDGSVGVVEHEPRVRLLHASPATPAVDVYARGELAFANVGFTQGTERRVLPSELIPVEVVPAGGVYPDAILFGFDLPLRDGRDYTAVMWGNTRLMAGPLTDSARGLPPGSIRLKLVHAAEGLPPVDVRDEGAGSVLATGLSMGTIETLDLPAGTYRIGLDVGADGTSDHVFEIPDLGRDLFVNVLAVREGQDVKLIAQLPNGATRVIEAD